jgi:hypothetical protein
MNLLQLQYFLIFGFRKPGTGFTKKPGTSSGFNEYGSSTLSILLNFARMGSAVDTE